MPWILVAKYLNPEDPKNPVTAWGPIEDGAEAEQLMNDLFWANQDLGQDLRFDKVTIIELKDRDDLNKQPEIASRNLP